MTAPGLRFAMVTTFYPPYTFGGDGVYVRRLAHALARRGHRVDVLHDKDAYHLLRKGRDDPTPLTEPAGVHVHGLRSTIGPLSCLATQQLGRPIVHGHNIARLLDQDFDVIHFHNISLIGGPGILSYGRGLKLYTTHEHWLVCPSHILWRHNREVCEERQCLRCVLRHHRLPQLWRTGSLLKRQSRHVDAFLTLSRFCAGKHHEFGFEHPMTVVPSFLPEEEDLTQPVADTPGAGTNAPTPPYFLFVGRLEAIKGVQDVIPAFTGRDHAAEFWIAGRGRYEAELRRLAADAPHIKFLGQQTPAALRRLYRRALAVITPSKCYEVFPMVVLEAFREGVPIVARNLGPYPEIIAQSKAGLLFDTEEGLVAALRQLATDAPYRDKLGRAARQAFDRFWSEDVAMAAYFDVIAKVATKRGRDDILAKLADTHRREPADVAKAEPAGPATTTAGFRPET